MTYQDCGINIIKCDNKVSNDELKELHYELNGFIYKRLKRLVTKFSVQYIIEHLIQYGVKINNLEVNDNVKPKKKEILTKIKQIIKTLSNIVFDDNVNYDTTNVQKFIVSSYLRQKDNLSIQQLISFLDDIKEIKEEYQISNPIKSLQNANSELLTLLTNYYQ